MNLFISRLVSEAISIDVWSLKTIFAKESSPVSIISFKRMSSFINASFTFPSLVILTSPISWIIDPAVVCCAKAVFILKENKQIIVNNRYCLSSLD